MNQTSLLTNPAAPAADRQSQALADRLERGAQGLISFASTLSDTEWRMPLPKDGRPIGVIVHHVASVYPIEIELAERVARGEPITGVTSRDIDAMNATHASEHAGVTKEEAIDLLRRNSTVAADAIRRFTLAELQSAAPASLYEDAPVTAQFVLEDHAVRHSYHHLFLIRRALAR